jgi:hypothetical protein
MELLTYSSPVHTTHPENPPFYSSGFTLLRRKRRIEKLQERPVLVDTL